MKMGKIVRKLGIRPNDVIMVKADSEIAKGGNIERFIGMLNETNIQDVIVVVVDDFDDIRKLDENEMRKHGWLKVSRLSRLVNRVPKEKDGE